MTIELTYIVEGMSCAHCQSAVAEEVSQLAGVDTVDVDLEAKRVVVRGSDVRDADVREAIDEAGYDAVPA